jgi:hypothetical protein
MDILQLYLQEKLEFKQQLKSLHRRTTLTRINFCNVRSKKHLTLSTITK